MAGTFASWLHGMQAVFGRMYGHIPPGAPPPAAPRTQAWIRQMAAARALAQLVAALGPRAVLPVKGVVTARTLYADLAERPIADLDVRVDGLAGINQVIDFANKNGFEVRHVSRAYGSAVLDVDGLDVDVEGFVGPPGLCRRTVRQMLDDATVSEVPFGFPCAIPDLCDHALLLAINAFKDKLVLAPEGAVEDLRRIGRDPRFDPPRLAAVARAASAAAIVGIVACWLRDEEPAWAAVDRALGRRGRRRVYGALYRWLAATAPRSLASRVLARVGADDLGLRVRALASASAFVRGG